MFLKRKKHNNVSLIQSFSSDDDREPRYKPFLFWSRTLLMVIMGSLGFGLLFACIILIDEVVIARGELQGLGGERYIKANQNKTIKTISVDEGQLVEKNQILLEFDTTVLDAQLESLNAKMLGLKSFMEIESEILLRLNELVDVGALTFVDYLKQKKRVEEIQSNILQLQANIKEIQYQKKSSTLISPLKGKVFDLVPSSPGYAAIIGETLLKIAPQGELEAKVFINNKDIGFVKEGMSAKVRLDAYPFVRFGELNGKLKSIGTGIVPANQQNPLNRFPAYVALNKQFIERKEKIYNFRSGDSVSVHFIVRQKPIINLITDIFANALDALREIKS
tara:strand:+ start:1542 stop:2546 length:1005 start_codon:yes stop_codon:yes gene_type:complete